MKKSLAFLMCLSAAGMLTACGGKTDTAQTTAGSTQAPAAGETTAEAKAETKGDPVVINYYDWDIPDQKFIEVDTRNILFIAGGAFDGIERKISQRLNKQTVGYSAISKGVISQDNIMQYIAPQDLKAFGIIPELIGRLPVITHLDSLDRESLRRILTEPKNAVIKQYERLFEMDGIKLKIDGAALDYIVDKAMEFKIGARGLRSLCEAVFMDAMFEMPENPPKEFRVTKKYAEKKLARFAAKQGGNAA